MSIIKCPNCSGDISDRATTCVHCGAVIKEYRMNRCEECGAALEPGDTICRKCGCPVDDNQIEIFTDDSSEVVMVNEPTQNEEIQLNEVKRKGIFSKLLVVLIIVCAIAGGFFYHNYSIEQKFGENLIELVTLIDEGYTESCDCCNIIRDVWHNSIYYIADDKTDKYTRPDGSWLDFQDALDNLYADKKFKARLEKLAENQSDAYVIWLKLKDYSGKHVEIVDAVEEVYDAYVEYTDLAIYHNGSYNSFSDEFDRVHNNMEKAYRNFESFSDSYL